MLKIWLATIAFLLTQIPQANAISFEQFTGFIQSAFVPTNLGATAVPTLVGEDIFATYQESNGVGRVTLDVGLPFPGSSDVFVSSGPASGDFNHGVIIFGGNEPNVMHLIYLGAPNYGSLTADLGSVDLTIKLSPVPLPATAPLFFVAILVFFILGFKNFNPFRMRFAPLPGNDLRQIG
jgi:hypothetical protein